MKSLFKVVNVVGPTTPRFSNQINATVRGNGIGSRFICFSPLLQAPSCQEAIGIRERFWSKWSVHKAQQEIDIETGTSQTTVRPIVLSGGGT